MTTIWVIREKNDPKEKI